MQEYQRASVNKCVPDGSRMSEWKLDVVNFQNPKDDRYMEICHVSEFESELSLSELGVDGALVLEVVGASAAYLYVSCEMAERLQALRTECAAQEVTALIGGEGEISLRIVHAQPYDAPDEVAQEFAKFFGEYFLSEVTVGYHTFDVAVSTVLTVLRAERMVNEPG